MRALWKGSISFGLVTIPVGLHNASRVEELKFRLLRSPDLSPVNYKRVAQTDGKEVPWDHIVKGYEYEKGKFVVLKDEDFRRVDLEATDTIDIIDFVEAASINPVFFYKPYYIEPLKGGSAAYTLLREVLADSGKVGISKVIIRTRQHLAAIKPNGNLLALELMRFEDELIEPADIKLPAKEKVVGKREVTMAKTLIDQMTEKWDPARYTDDYRSALMKLIDKKVAAGGKEVPSHKTAKAATNVIDLASVLQQSLADAAGGKKAKKPPKSAKATKGKKKAA